MSDNIFLKRLFQAYYQEKQKEIPAVSSLEFREFGFIPWEKQIMIRHIGFESQKGLLSYLIDRGPKHVYSSGSLYLQPEAQHMENKQYQGCDLIVDIDVDHFYTPCKDEHDSWYCNNCDTIGTGMIEKCPKCEKSKITKFFLIPDFGTDEKDMRIAFSGHRGYHLKVESEELRKLNSEERREIVDYLTGENISFEVLGLGEKSQMIQGLLKENIGWSQKIMEKVIEILNRPKNEIENMFLDENLFGFTPFYVGSFLNYKDDFLDVITKGERNIWAIEGFGLTNWKKLLRGIVKLIGIELDEPVSIDIHRLIRYPGSLHGKTGFKVQEIELNQLDDFNPLDESDENLDPIVFYSKNVTQKLEIVERTLPITKIKGAKFGPYVQGEKIEVPHHIAVFLLCKGVAKTI